LTAEQQRSQGELAGQISQLELRLKRGHSEDPRGSRAGEAGLYLNEVASIITELRKNCARLARQTVIISQQEAP